ncbi:helix-turn-helix transcriptional regulator [Halostella litorea]|uniref:helix-turn-helix transcriptional regulator n=1 Tax=Halostella litorea TaxID=2528831 RepID=UPI001092078E|nr:MarR family transcriptional regulator [Halostella litorea]
MNARALRTSHLAAAVVFIAAVLVLAVQLITPSPVVVSVGESGAETTQVGQYFTYDEVAVVAVAALVSGASGTYLVLGGRARAPADPPTANGPAEPAPSPAANGGGDADRAADDSEDRRERREATLDRLGDNEATIYSMLLDADGEIPQRALVEGTDLSKATVSRTLDNLEHRGLVERKRSGIGNTVHLQEREIRP